MLFVGALDATTRRTLARLRDTAAPDLAFRSEIILLSADGWDVAGIARILFCSMRTVYRWLHKFIQVGLRGICLKRVGRPPRSTQNSDPEDEKSRTIPAPGTPVVGFSVAEMQRLVAFALQKPRDIAIGLLDKQIGAITTTRFQNLLCLDFRCDILLFKEVLSMLFIRDLDVTIRQTLRRLLESGSPDLALRSEIILLSADGWDVAGIARILSCSMKTVYRWLHKFLKEGLRGLCLKQVGRPRNVSEIPDQDDQK